MPADAVSLQPNTPAGTFKTRVLPALSIAAFAGVAVLYSVAVALAGGSLPGLFLFAAAFLLLVFLPGWWLCGLALPAARPLARAVLAVPVGAVVLMLAFVALTGFAPIWVCALPSAALGLLAVYKALDVLKSKKPRRPKLSAIPAQGWVLLLFFSAAAFLYIFSAVFPYARVQNAGNMTYNQDLLWSVGNAAAAGYGSPLPDLRTAGGVLHYHYFIDVLNGLLAAFTGQNAWDAICYFNWPVWAGLLTLSLYAVSRGFGASRWASLLAPFGVLFAHTNWDGSYLQIYLNMNGVLQSNFFLVAVVVALQQAERENYRNWKGLPVLLAAATALLWGKSTIGILVVCGLFAAGVVGWVLHKKPNTWLFAAAVGSAAVFGLLYLFIYRHAINNLLFQPEMIHFLYTFQMIFTRYLPATLLYIASLFFSLRGFRTLGYPALLANALVPGGMAAFFLFNHYSFSQSYFLLAACFAMWLCAGRVADALCTKRVAVAAVGLVCAASLASTLWYARDFLRTGVQSALRCLHLRPSFEVKAESLTPDDGAAAAWLAENMQADDVFATNRNARNLDAADGIFHYYTAASGQQAFVESWRYAMDYSIDYHLLRHNLEAVSDGIFAAETYEEAAALARENGITHLLVYLPAGPAHWEDAAPAFASDTVLIYIV